MTMLRWNGLALAAALGTIGIGGCTLDPTYTDCFDSSDCEVDEQCFEIATAVSIGEFCSSNCVNDAQCESNLGFFGSCLDPDGAGGICFQECVFDADCFSSSVCVEFTDATGFFNTVCLPDN
jgi:hypothetical protein